MIVGGFGHYRTRLIGALTKDIRFLTGRIFLVGSRYQGVTRQLIMLPRLAMDDNEKRSWKAPLFPDVVQRYLVTVSTTALKAAGSFAASSARILRSSSMFDFLIPAIS